MVKSIILRPQEDIKLNYDENESSRFFKIPSENSNAYSLINEQNSDEDSTCIYTDSSKALVQFRLDGIIPSKKIQIKGLILACSVKSENFGTFDSANFSVYLNNTKYEFGNYGDSSSESWNLKTVKMETESKIVCDINSYIEQNSNEILHDIIVEISVDTNHDGYKAFPTLYISQIYLEVLYDYGFSLYRKVSGTLVNSTAAYRKVNDAWAEISEDECKNILQNNTIRSG